jgi:hypothetical protein
MSTPTVILLSAVLGTIALFGIGSYAASAMGSNSSNPYGPSDTPVIPINERLGLYGGKKSKTRNYKHKQSKTKKHKQI